MFDFLFHNLRGRRGAPDSSGEEHPLPVRNPELVFNPFGRIADAVKTTVDAMNKSFPETEEEMRQALSKIAVVAFIGPSGTGKSTRALKVAKENHVSYLIDDGILIHGSRIVAGSSAKRASTKIESVKWAIFADETRAATMRRALVEEMPTTLMILGTSRDMLDRICHNLWLSKPAMLIRIEDVSTEEERRIARQIRTDEGKHTIPVPAMEIRHEFSGTLAEPIHKWRRRLDRNAASSWPQNVDDPERTVVRPTFSTLGSYSLSDEAMREIVEILLKRVSGIAELVEIRSFNETGGVRFQLQVALYYGFPAGDAMQRAQTAVSEVVERLTAINVLSVDIRAVRLVHPPEAANA